MKNKFTDLELEFIDKFVTCISHCTYNWRVEEIFESYELKPQYDGLGDPYMHNKVYCRVNDTHKSKDSAWCGVNGVEFRLNKKLFEEKLFYIMTLPQSHGYSSDALYLSPYLFDIVTVCEFNLENYIKYIKTKLKIDKDIISALLWEAEGLFKSKVIKERYNPPISSLIILCIHVRKKYEIRWEDRVDYNPTIAFFEPIDPTKYLEIIRIDDDKRNKFLEIETLIASITDLCHKRNIKCIVEEFDLRR
jgi:hypothetical protein